MRMRSRKSKDQLNSQMDIQPKLQSRPFETTTKTSNQNANLKDIEETTAKLGRSFADIPIFGQEQTENVISLQPKLNIGASGDKFEQEADQVAHQVGNQISANQGNSLRLKADRGTIVPEAMSTEETIRRMPLVQCLGDTITGSATNDFESSLQTAKGGGQSLANNVRQSMEGAFGANFNKVKVHTDVQSDQLSQSIQAKAFTTGTDIFFKTGSYNPSSKGGKELLAHELTHVVQQGGANVQWQSEKTIAEEQNIASIPKLQLKPAINNNKVSFGVIQRDLDPKYDRNWLDNVVSSTFQSKYNQHFSDIKRYLGLYKKFQQGEHVRDNNSLLLRQINRMNTNLAQWIRQIDTDLGAFPLVNDSSIRRAKNNLETLKRELTELQTSVITEKQTLQSIQTQPEEKESEVVESQQISEEKQAETSANIPHRLIPGTKVFLPKGINMYLPSKDRNITSHVWQWVTLGRLLPDGKCEINISNLTFVVNLSNLDLTAQYKDEDYYKDDPRIPASFANAKLMRNPDLQYGLLRRGARYQNARNLRTEKAPTDRDIFVSIIKDERNGKYQVEVYGTQIELIVNYSDIDFTSGYQDDDRELFPNRRALIDDVRQAYLGDCFLQAALASVAEINPDYIRNMIKESRSDNSVIVRLHKVDRTNPDHPRFIPRYIKVSRSIPMAKGKVNNYNRGALWVHMIQKAYVAGGFLGTPNEDRGTHKKVSENESYANLNEGIPEHTMEVLLGQASEKTDLYRSQRRESSIFENIEDALQDGTPVTISTNDSIDVSGRQLGTSGEEVYGGLAGGHTYGVLRTKRTNTKNPYERPNSRGRYSWLQVFNPWGRNPYIGSGSYKEPSLTGVIPIDDNRGLFWVDSRMLKTYFKEVNFGKTLSSISSVSSAPMLPSF